MRFRFVFIWYALLSTDSFSGEVRNFQTDFCTAYSEGTLKNPELWRDCCITHDLYYWGGGTSRDRNEADLSLEKCVADTGATVHARIIFLGVKLGALSPFKLKGKQWGNAWGDSPRTTKLSRAEIDLLEDSLNQCKNTELTEQMKLDYLAELKNQWSG